MPKRIDRFSRSRTTAYQGRHRYEHWLVDNQVYFLTARCRDRFPAFATEAAKAVFWDRFDHYTAEFGFVPWVTSLLDNHYHTLGYLRVGANLPKMMQRIHGSVAKLVNDLLPSTAQSVLARREGQGILRRLHSRRSDRRGLHIGTRLRNLFGTESSADWRDYQHTHVNVELERAIARALEIDAFLEGVPYKRYLDRKHTAR